MFSTIVQKFLISYLGQYIDGIKNSMDVALLKGRIKIQKVSLKKDFFNNLSLPLRLGFSRVESIDLHIPCTNLKQKSTTVQINGIYALFYVNYELQEYKFDIEARFQQMIDKATEMIKMKFEQKTRQPDSIVEKYILRIVDNLKIKVKNIHVRLESVERGWDFSFGMLINKISVRTVNENGDKHFFIRAKNHHHHHMHRKSKQGEDILFKKIQVQNVDFYCTQTENEFLTLIEDKEILLTKMKQFLSNTTKQITYEVRQKSSPNIILRLKIQAMIRAKLNQNSKYDIDVKTNLCPLVINLTDRMTAQLFYFLQFTFQWQMQKYKKPNKDACMSIDMINFYKLVLANVLQDIPLHTNDYKTVMKLISEWSYSFLNQITLEFIQDQRVKRQLARRKNHKLIGDPIKLEELKKEIEDRLLTQQDKKQMYNILGKISLDVKVPSLQLVFLSNSQQRVLLNGKNKQILKIGLENITIHYNTVIDKSTMLTMSIRNFVLQSGDKIQKIPFLQEFSNAQSFLTIIYTKAEHKHVESCSIVVSKRSVFITEEMVSDILSWADAIRLRPATIHYLKEVFVNYFTQIVKKLLLKLFRQFRVINLNIGLPIIQVKLKQKGHMLKLDCGRLEGKNLNDKVYRFRLAENVKIIANEKVILTIEEDTMMEIFDKMKSISNQGIYEFIDHQKINLKIKSIKIQNLEQIIIFFTTLICCPIVEQFFRLKIVEDHSLLLQGRFYLNNNLHRQKMILKCNQLFFLPSKYSIQLKRCKVYQMKEDNKNFLVFHSLLTNKADLIEVESEIGMETIFYKLRELIHQNATSTEWDLFYKSDYPVQIDKLQVLKSQQGQNFPLFTFQVDIGRILIPLQRYLNIQKGRKQRQSTSINLRHQNVIKFLDTNDVSFLETNVSKLQIDNIYTKVSFYQRTTDLISEVKDVKLVIDDQSIFKKLSLVLQGLISQFLFVNFQIHEFQVLFSNKDALKGLFEIAMFFQNKIEGFLRIVKECQFLQMMQEIGRQNQQFSVLQSSKSLTHHQLSRDFRLQQRSKTKFNQQLLISSRIVFDLKSFKVNILNYITEIKQVNLQMETYRGENFPFLKLQIEEIILLSSLQVVKVILNVQNDRRQIWKYVCGLKIDKIISYPHLECFILDFTQGQISLLLLEVMQQLEKRKKSKTILMNKQNYNNKSFKQQQHIKFESFVSPIKQKNAISSKKYLQQSMKSLTDQLQAERQIYLFVFNAQIEHLQAQITLQQNLNAVKLSAQSIRLLQNHLKINNLKLLNSDQQILGCQNIEWKFPRNHSPFQIQSRHNLSIQMKLKQFESPTKRIEEQPLLEEQKIQIIRSEEIIKSQKTHILIDGVKINIDMKFLSETLIYGQQLLTTLLNSKQYAMLKANIQKLMLNILRKRQTIENLIEKGTQKLQSISQNLKPPTQFPNEINWIINTKQMFSSFYLQTITPISGLIYSLQQKQFLSFQISTKIDSPLFVSSIISLEIKHFNKLIQIYEPVLENIQVQLQKIDKKLEFKVLIENIKAVVSQEFLIDLCRDISILKEKLSQTSNKTKQLRIEDLQFKKLKLFQRYNSFSLVQETLKDFEFKKSHKLQHQLNILTSQKHRPHHYLEREAFSKLTVKNYTQCEVLCQLGQASFSRQQIRVISEYQKQNIGFADEKIKEYFIIPTNKTAKNYSLASQFLQREFPLKMKLSFINQNYAFSSINFQTLLSEISHVGQKREYQQLFYQDQEGYEHSTMIQIYLRFDYIKCEIIMDIKSKIEVLNYTVLDLGLLSLKKKVFQDQQQIQLEKQRQYQIGKGKSTFLPVWFDNKLAIKLNNYQTKISLRHYTIPLQSQQNLTENYPTQNYLLLKEQFIHYFEIKLGSQYCWIPLLFVRLKKFEKIFNKKIQQVKFKQVKCKIMILPLVKVQNHCGRQLWINSENFSSIKNYTKYQIQKQRAIYFFLHHQYKKNLQSILFSFSQKGLSYHISLPQHLYVPKPLKFPIETASLSPISLNLLSVKNQFGQMILHFYPIAEIIVEMPFNYFSCQMSCKNEQNKSSVCQGLNVQNKKTNEQVSSFGQMPQVSYLVSDDCKKLKITLECQDKISVSDYVFGYFSTTLPSKKNLGYIEIFSPQFSTSQSESSSSSSQSIAVSEESSEDLQKIQNKIIYIPVTTKQGEMLFAKYEMKRIKRKFALEEQLISVYTAEDVQNFKDQNVQKKKYEDFYVFQLKCIPEKSMATKLVEQLLVKQINQVQKVKQIEKKIKSKLASRNLVLFIKNVNLSLIVRKPVGHQSFIHPGIITNFNNSKLSGERHQLINLTIGQYEMNLSLAIDDNYKLNDIHIEQKIGKILLNSINCQKKFRDTILRLSDENYISIITGFSRNQNQLKPLKSQLKQDQNGQNSKKTIQPQKIQIIPTFKLDKILVKLVNKKQFNSQEHEIQFKLTDLFVFECMNWIIKMYPFISPLVVQGQNRSLLRNMIESNTISDFLKTFQGLILFQSIKLKLSFISLAKRSTQKNDKKRKIKKQLENQQIQTFFYQILQISQSFRSKNNNLAYTESKTMQKVLKYVKKIPFNILEIQKATIKIPQISINGKISDETASQFETDLMINFTTGILKGMKILGSPGSLIDYVQHNSKLKKRQKISGLLNYVAKGSIKSFTGILKAFSNGISELTFDEKYIEERQDAITKKSQIETTSNSQQGLQSLFLGFKSGFTGLIEQPIQNYKDQGAQGFIKGALKGFTGMFTKPLTGMLDLGAKTLDSIRGQKKRSSIQQSNFLNASDHIYCRPLFHQCSLTKIYNQMQYLAYIVLKSVLKKQQNFGLVSAIQMKQNPFNQDEKQNENIILNEDKLTYVLAICSNKTYFIELGNVQGLKVISKVIDHKFIKMVGRDENGVCLVMKEVLEQDQDENKENKIYHANQIFLSPMNIAEKDQIYKIYKKLTKK